MARAHWRDHAARPATRSQPPSPEGGLRRSSAFGALTKVPIEALARIGQLPHFLLARIDIRSHYLRRGERGYHWDWRGWRAAQREPKFAHAENHQGNSEGNDVVEQPEQEEPREQVLLVELPERDQHGSVEDADSAGRVAGKAEQ